MSKSICFFNHKGGVSKTTTTFNIGWQLANMGNKVMMVDLDSQCNLTGVVLGYNVCKEDGDLENFYQNKNNLTMEDIVSALISGDSAEAFVNSNKGVLTSTGNEDLFLLPGHLDVSDLDSQISVALKIAQGVPATKKIPAGLPKIITLLANKYGIDYILYDLSPNVGGLNEVILMSSDYFIVPTSPDFFCWQAVGSLAKNIKKWHEEIEYFKKMNGFSEDRSYAIKNCPKFLGTIQQRYRPRNGSPAKSFENWICKIREEISDNLVPVLRQKNCIADETKIKQVLSQYELEPYDLAHIADFNSLIAISQEFQVPVYALTREQIASTNQFGHALNTMEANKESFNAEFKALAQRVIDLT
ncbi:regulatory protein [Campylobacter mucosalis]|uniref:ParA family protein n=1 Tax=Campylobacter mucosalis TaxID=202 RepID=UPI0004D405A7|nr:AAA family ATPase [Campylobacter mucosalis]KEA46554.1 regulatory protein [Campylobacter mucosalis]QKF62942.1 hypothetical protein CMCT_0803 [Campylobacter mucosalis]